MPEIVTAQDGDTLCGLAIAAGFPNCEPLRNEPANSEYLNRPLRAGDAVTIPDPEEEEEEGATEAEHVFEELGVPEPEIRFIHGSQDRLYEDDDSLTFLNASNYVTNRAGTNGTRTMPTTYGFNAHAHADPDTFKIEVVDPGAGNNTVDVTLEALKPIYAADGSVERHASFANTDPDANMRQITVTCQQVSSSSQVRFRSRYMRLVVDDEDFNALSGTSQTLLTTDMADGNNGANDKIEILDQRIRATYQLRSCPAPAGQHKCTIAAELPFEDIRQRIRLCVHVFKESVGGANAANITEQHVRRRTMKWFRRAYAQISMAPKLVACRTGGPEIEFLDPPPDNMIAISEEHGRPVSATGGPYTITFRLGLPPGDVADAEAAATAAGLTAADARPNVTVNLTNGWTPEQVANAIVTAVGALPGNIFRAEAFRNARGFTATNRSYDVLITRTDNRRVMIENENLTAGAGITLDVARVNITNVDGAISNSLPLLNPSLRRLIREGPGTDDRLDVYVCREFTAFGGLGIIPHTDLGADYRPDSPIRWAFFAQAASNVMDGSDNHPWLYPHEAGHVLPDAFHIDSGSPHDSTCLMRGGVVLSTQHPVDATKRIFDAPVMVRYAYWDPAQPTVGASISQSINMAQRFRDRSGSVTEAW